jgi:hypothetical protein
MQPKKSVRRVLLWLSIATLMTPLAGCVTGGSSRVTCPPLVTYSREFQRTAAAALDQLPPGSPVGVLVTDYSKLRDACRAIRA